MMGKVMGKVLIQMSYMKGLGEVKGVLVGLGQIMSSEEVCKVYVEYKRHLVKMRMYERMDMGAEAEKIEDD